MWLDPWFSGMGVLPPGGVWNCVTLVDCHNKHQCLGIGGRAVSRSQDGSAISPGPHVGHRCPRPLASVSLPPCLPPTEFPAVTASVLSGNVPSSDGEQGLSILSHIPRTMSDGLGCESPCTEMTGWGGVPLSRGKEGCFQEWGLDRKNHSRFSETSLPERGWEGDVLRSMAAFCPHSVL